MTAALLVAGFAGWVGMTLLLAELRWFARRPLAERVAPYVPGGHGRVVRGGLLSVESFRAAIGPVARSLGARFARLVGVSEDLDRRLRRIHASLDVTEYRVRQLGWALAGLGAGGLLSVAARPPAGVAVLFVLGAPLLGFLLLEGQVVAASERWKHAARLELPVVAEQLGMLLGAGYSLSGAVDRVSRRGRGVVAQDLARVRVRIRQGVSEERALREWAELADVAAVTRLVAVLALNRAAADLGHLISAEARNLRREVQRDLVATMERRGQQVWVPVTVATLLPGVIFIGVPFVSALSGFLE